MHKDFITHFKKEWGPTSKVLYNCITVNFEKTQHGIKNCHPSPFLQFFTVDVINSKPKMMMTTTQIVIEGWWHDDDMIWQIFISLIFTDWLVMPTPCHAQAA